MPGELYSDFEKNILINSEIQPPPHKPKNEDETVEKMSLSETSKEIKKDFPAVENIEPIYERGNKAGEWARANQIHSENVTGVSFEGFDMSPLKYLDNRPLWQFEPRGRDFFENWADRMGNSKDRHHITEAAYSGDKAEIWRMVEETAASQEVSDKLGKVDLKNLTPYEATFLIGALMKSKMLYDFGAGGYMDTVKSQTSSTARPDLLSRWESDKNDYYVQQQKYNKELDNMPADVLLKNGWGTCRHFASAGYYIYEMLKEKQEAIYLNGTYFLPYITSLGVNENNTGIEKHAVNLLVVTAPENEDSTGKLFLGVIDNTMSVTKELDNMDETMRGFYAIPQFVKNFGEDFGIETPRAESRILADEMVKRIEKQFLGMSAEQVHDIFNTYASLLSMSSIEEKGLFISHLLKARTEQISDSMPYNLERMFEIPAVSKPVYRAGGPPREFRIIRSQYVPEIYEEINKVDFSEISKTEDSEHWEDVAALFEAVRDNFFALNASTIDKDYERMFSTRDYPAHFVTSALMKAYVESDKRPAEYEILMINEAVSTIKRHRDDAIDPVLWQKFQKLCEGK